MELKKNMQNYYEKIYANRVSIEKLRKLKSFIPFKRIKKELFIKYARGNNILEVGCGLGEYLELFDGNLYGTDISLNALEKAKIFCSKAKFFQANGEKLPIKNNSFDCILLPDVIEHIENDQALLNEVYRILKKDGRILITSHFSRRYYTKELKNPNLWTNVLGEGGDLRLYGLDLIDKLKVIGFKKVEFRLLYGPITNFINELKMKILKRKGIDRKDILSGQLIKKTKYAELYSKILYLLYRLDYFLFSKRKGYLFFLVMEKS